MHNVFDTLFQDCHPYKRLNAPAQLTSVVIVSIKDEAFLTSTDDVVVGFFNLIASDWSIRAPSNRMVRGMHSRVVQATYVSPWTSDEAE